MGETVKVTITTKTTIVDLVSIIATCKKHNTNKWMNYVAHKCNKVLMENESPERIEYRKDKKCFVVIHPDGTVEI